MIRILLASLFAFSAIAAVRGDDPKPGDEQKLAKDRASSMNNLKQIGLAFHGYTDANRRFPNNVADKANKPLLSWRVLLLPYLGQDELFKQFKLDEPWDSTHNKKLLEKMPKVYTPVRGEAGKGETFYRGFTGAGTIFETGKELGFRNVTDGLSNTIFCVESAKPVPWTKPDDLPFDPKKDDLPKLGGMFEAGFNCVLCDGSARFIKKDAPKETLKAMITSDGGEVFVSPE